MLATPDRSQLRSIVYHIYELALCVCVCDTLCIFLQSISSSFSQFDHLFIGYDSRLPSTLGFSLLGKLPNVSPGISWWALLARLRRQRLWSVKSTCIINHTPELDNLRLGHLWISGVGSWSVVPTDSVLVVSASWFLSHFCDCCSSQEEKGWNSRRHIHVCSVIFTDLCMVKFLCFECSWTAYPNLQAKAVLCFPIGHFLYALVVRIKLCLALFNPVSTSFMYSLFLAVQVFLLKCQDGGNWPGWLVFDTQSRGVG